MITAFFVVLVASRKLSVCIEGTHDRLDWGDASSGSSVTGVETEGSSIIRTTKNGVARQRVARRAGLVVTEKVEKQ